MPDVRIPAMVRIEMRETNYNHLMTLLESVVHALYHAHNNHTALAAIPDPLVDAVRLDELREMLLHSRIQLIDPAHPLSPDSAERSDNETIGAERYTK